MLWIIGLFTVVLVLDSLFLILLVLVQLPKKEAGVGQAFGGTATDALFGAGSGNALTKMTKYATGIFFVLTLGIYIMYNHHSRSGSGRFARQIQEAGRQSDGTPSASPGSTPSKTIPLLATNAVNTNVAPAKATNENKGGLLITPQSAPTQPKPSTESTPQPAAPAK
jgi:protein translocase SecG subunit